MYKVASPLPGRNRIKLLGKKIKWGREGRREGEERKRNERRREGEGKRRTREGEREVKEKRIEREGKGKNELKMGGWGRKPATLYIPETFHLYKQIYLFIANRIFFHFEKIKRIIEV